jgi:hypothetical protein
MFPSLPLVPKALQQPAGEVENQMNSSDSRPDLPPDYDSHLVPGIINILKGSLSIPENHSSG